MASGDSVPLFREYFFIGEIAGGIRGPKVPGYRLRPDPEIPGADIEPSAPGTASSHILLLLFESSHQRV
jgi:hypothetical protein